MVASRGSPTKIFSAPSSASRKDVERRRRLKETRNELMNRFARRLAPLTLVVMNAVAGCSAPDPFSGADFERSISTQPLPYVALVREVAITDLDGGTATTAVGKTFPLDVTQTELAIRRTIEEALDRHAVFAAVGSDEGDLALRGLVPEIEIEIAIRQIPGVTEYAHSNSDMKWVNLFLWIFAGLPGWIIEDTYVDPGVRGISCRVVRRRGDDRRELSRFELDLSEVNKLNFLRRASWAEYFIQILVPPFLVTSNQEVARESLWENHASRIQSGIPSRIKDGLARSLVGKLPQIIVVEPVVATGGSEEFDSAATSDDFEILIFSDVIPESVRVDALAGEPGAVLKRRLLETEPDVVEEEYWTPAARTSLGQPPDFLAEYRYKLRVTAPGLLRDLERRSGGMLRVSLEVPSGRQLVEQTWTVRY
jgi:hypothetical protein